MTAFRCDLTGSLTTRAFMRRVAQARDNRAPRSRPQPARRSQMTTSSVSNDGTDGIKRRSVTRPTVSNDGTVGAILGGQTVSNDGTHIIYHPQGEARQAAEPPRESLHPSRRKASRASGRGVATLAAATTSAPSERNGHPSAASGLSGSGPISMSADATQYPAKRDDLASASPQLPAALPR
jgi:hypothetical protein